MAVKDNQGTLHDAAKCFFDTDVEPNFHGYPVDMHHTVVADHGQIGTRRCWTTSSIYCLEEGGA